MQVWTIANQKGGVGKTTTTAALAGFLSKYDAQVLLIDLDPQGSLSTYFGCQVNSVKKGVYDVFQAKGTPRLDAMFSLVHETNIAHVAIVPASVSLATVDRQLGQQPGMGLIISRFLEQLVDDYDHVLIDCPPVLGVLMINALAACNQVVVPVQTEFLALKGLERMQTTLKMVRKNPSYSFDSLIVPTMFDRRVASSHHVLEQTHQKYGKQVWHDVIPVDAKLSVASEKGVPISHAFPQSRSGAAYGQLVKDLLLQEEEKEDKIESNVTQSEVRIGEEKINS